MCIIRMARHLSERICERYPTWLSTGTIKPNRSAVVLNLTQTNDTVNEKEAFCTLSKVKPQQSRLAECFLLSITESVAIRLLNPRLFAKNDLWLPFNSPGSPYVPIQILDHKTIYKTRSAGFGLCIEDHQLISIHIFIWLI